MGFAKKLKFNQRSPYVLKGVLLINQIKKIRDNVKDFLVQKLKVAKSLLTEPVTAQILRWYTGVAIAIAGLEVAFFKGYLSDVYDNDVTKISVAIFSILLWQTYRTGKILFKTYQSVIPEDAIASCKDEIESGWFWSDNVLSLGMIGTVIGFMTMLSGFITLDITDPESVQSIIAQLGSGMATALTTTLVGLIASVLIKIQFFMIENTK